MSGGGGVNVAGGAAAASLAGGPVNYYNPAYGGVPTMPNPTATAAAANAGNAANLPGFEGTAANLNTFNQGQLLGQYNMAIPNYAALTQTASGNAMQQLQGDVPQDVINQILQGAAERGITGGMPASPNSNAAYLRALGLTSIGQQQTGMQNLAQLVSQAPIAPIFNPAQMFVSPQDMQEAQYMANVLKASPSPEAAAENAIALGQPQDKSGVPWWARGSSIPQVQVYHTPAGTNQMIPGYSNSLF